MSNPADRRYLLAALLGRWPQFYQWLSDKHDFRIDTATPGEPQHCPVHGGDSGQAFRFFDDMEFTGGGICNSRCKLSHSTGDRLVEGWLSQYKGIPASEVSARADALFKAFLTEHGLAIPAERVTRQLGRWLRAHETDLAIRYLGTRGLRFDGVSLPASLRATSNYWVSNEYQSAFAFLALVRDQHGNPVTHQATLLNARARKLGTDADDETLLATLPERDRKSGKPVVKFLGALRKEVSLRGLHVDLGNQQGNTLLMGEGIESSLAARKIYEHIHRSTPQVRAVLTSYYATQIIPDDVAEVIVFADGDHTQTPVLDQVRQLAALYPTKTFLVAFAPMWEEVLPTGETVLKNDWLDLLNRDGTDKASEIFQQEVLPVAGEQTVSTQPVRPVVPPRSTAPMIKSSLPVEDEFDEQTLDDLDSTRPQVRTSNVYDHELFRELNGVFLSIAPPWYWHESMGLPVRIEGGVLKPITHDVAASWLATHVDFVRVKDEEDGPRVRKAKTPTASIRLWWGTEDLMALLKTQLPSLRGILNQPTLIQEGEKADGTPNYLFVRSHGYDPATRYYLHLSKESEEALSIVDYILMCAKHEPEKLIADLSRCEETAAIAQRFREPAYRSDPMVLAHAYAALFFRHGVHKELLSDFHFATKTDEVNAMAMLMTPLLAQACPAVPFMLVEAPQRGSGKTTLAAMGTQLWTASPAQYGFPSEDAELEKRIGAAFEQNKQLIMFDNISQRLKSDTLARLLTDPRGSLIRRLGSNASITPPPGVVLYGTANNPEVQEEILRRTLIVRMVPRVVDPSLRDNFRHTDPVGHVSLNRANYQAAFYLLLQTWLSSGGSLGRCPHAFASFQPWANLCHTLMKWAYVEEADALVANRSSRLSDGDSETEELAQYMELWASMDYAQDYVHPATLVELAERYNLLGEIVGIRTAGQRTKEMGRWAHRLIGRPFKTERGLARIEKSSNKRRFGDGNLVAHGYRLLLD